MLGVSNECFKPEISLKYIKVKMDDKCEREREREKSKPVNKERCFIMPQADNIFIIQKQNFNDWH